MSAVKISSNIEFYTRQVNSSDYFSSTIKNTRYSARVSNDKRLVSIKNNVSNVAAISDQKPSARAETFLPFRIRLTNIGIQTYGRANPAPVGIAVIGTNNYIL